MANHATHDTSTHMIGHSARSVRLYSPPPGAIPVHIYNNANIFTRPHTVQHARTHRATCALTQPVECYRCVAECGVLQPAATCVVDVQWSAEGLRCNTLVVTHHRCATAGSATHDCITTLDSLMLRCGSRERHAFRLFRACNHRQRAHGPWGNQDLDDCGREDCVLLREGRCGVRRRCRASGLALARPAAPAGARRRRHGSTKHAADLRGA
eukprot:5972999-Prymnesium_polylepis.1